nr:MAG TPA: hypothetical protein [Caudoviricetes sp.]
MRAAKVPFNQGRNLLSVSFATFFVSSLFALSSFALILSISIST